MTNILYIGDPSSVHDIKWVSFFSTRPEFNAFFLVQKHEMHLITAERKAQFKALNITVEGPIHSYSLWRFWENKSSMNKINEVIKSRKIDVVHTLFATPFALWTKNLKVPSVITTRGSDVHVVLKNLGQGSLLQRIHGNILLNRFKAAFENAGAITCTSQGQLDRINQLFQTQLNAEIIRTGVNVDEINRLNPSIPREQKPNEKKVIFLPRYIQPIYQTELQIEALSALPKAQKEKLKLVLIKGKRTDKAYLKLINKKLENLGFEHQIIDSLTQHEMWSMFKHSALAIMTPKTDGTPNSALEAMAAKCPLVLGSFKYDEDLFSEQFCHRMNTESVKELTQLMTSALDNYSNDKLELAFENVAKNGNRQLEMGRIDKLYLSITKR
ncbi:MAG: glycosyltransferase involved in cell wall biosynthesis [Bacteroidia bacterium]|jgi:glycosyltransferase involved in cell wall biosynthesis